MCKIKRQKLRMEISSPQCHDRVLPLSVLDFSLGITFSASLNEMFVLIVIGLTDFLDINFFLPLINYHNMMIIICFGS